MRFRELKLRKDPDCPVCGTNPTVKELIDYEQFCGMPAAESSESPIEAPAGTTRATSIGPGGVPEMTAKELKAWMDENPRLQVLDVREPFEAQISRIEGATLIPLGELQKRYSELDPSRDLVVHCKVGGRSAKAVSFLRTTAFRRRSTSRVGFWPGATRWIRHSPSIDLPRTSESSPTTPESFGRRSASGRGKISRSCSGFPRRPTTR
jgi:adenylyltransferase/sulfurtransferase